MKAVHPHTDKYECYRNLNSMILFVAEHVSSKENKYDMIPEGTVPCFWNLFTSSHIDKYKKEVGMILSHGYVFSKEIKA